MSPDAVVEQMVERIVRGFHPRRVLLFGSHARGTAHQASDVDLLVIVDQVADKRQMAIEIRRALSDLPLAKDIVVTTPEEIANRGDRVGSVLRPALRDAKVLYDRQ